MKEITEQQFQTQTLLQSIQEGRACYRFNFTVLEGSTLLPGDKILLTGNNLTQVFAEIPVNGMIAGADVRSVAVVVPAEINEIHVQLALDTPSPEIERTWAISLTR